MEDKSRDFALSVFETIKHAIDDGTLGLYEPLKEQEPDPKFGCAPGVEECCKFIDTQPYPNGSVLKSDENGKYFWEKSEENKNDC